jgi:hypothetical protein
MTCLFPKLRPAPDEFGPDNFVRIVHGAGPPLDVESFPIRVRLTVSSFLRLLFLIERLSPFDNFGGASGTLATFHFEFLSPALVVRNKELFDLIQNRLADVVYRLQILVTIRVDGDANQAVICRPLAVLNLIGLDNPNHSDIKETSNVSGFVHQDHNVQGIAVLT